MSTKSVLLTIGGAIIVGASLGACTGGMAADPIEPATTTTTTPIAVEQPATEPERFRAAFLDSYYEMAGERSSYSDLSAHDLYSMSQGYVDAADEWESEGPTCQDVESFWRVVEEEGKDYLSLVAFSLSWHGSRFDELSESCGW